MVPSLDTPIVCPVLVGRAPQLAALQGCLDAALAGDGQTVLVAGEAGIGKSRLVAEAAKDARRRGALVLAGQCFEPDRTAPFAALLDLLRRVMLLRSPEIAAVLADAAPDLVRVLPELERSLPGTLAPPPLGPELDRRRAVHALTRFVEGLAAHRPLLLTIEDAHWGDEATLDAVLHLARALHTGSPVLLVVTYRGDQVGPDLAALLAALDRERLAAEIRLEPLSRADVGAMLRAMSDPAGDPSHRIAEGVAELAEGNPFFVEELLRTALAGNETHGGSLAVPRSVEEAVRRRVRLLGEGARRTLTLAAVAGRRFDFALLQSLNGCDRAEMLRRLKELIAAGLVVEAPTPAAESAPDGDFAFRHALTRQAIYADLLAPERRSLHHEVFEALRRFADDAGGRDRLTGDLARHAFAAGAWEEALLHGRQAGERALAGYAPRAAVEHFTRAVDAAARLGRPVPVLYRGRGQAFDLLGQFDAARRDFATAVALARAAGERAEEGQAQLALGQLWLGRDYATAGAYLHAARDAAEQSGDKAALARSLNRLGNWHVNLDRPVEAFRFHQDALTIFEAAGDQHGVAETLDLLGIARFLAGDMVGAGAAYRRAIDLLRSLDDRQTLVNALAILALAIGSLDNREVAPADGTGEEAQRFAVEAVTLARAIGWRPGEAMALCCAASIDACHRPTQALAIAHEGLRIADDLGHRQWQILAHGIIGQIHASILELPAAQQALERARDLARELNSSFWTWIIAAILTSLHVQRGDLARAAGILDAVLDDGTPMETWAQRSAWFSWAELMLARDRPNPALETVDRLLDAAGIGAEFGPERAPHLAYLRGLALVALGYLDEAAAALRAAHDGAIALGFRSLTWRVHLSLGQLARRRGDRAEADRADAAARIAVDELAATIEDQARRGDFVRNALAQFPGARPPSARQAAKAAFDGLTAREREVAALVAAGHSNREIGEALYLAERTAATHVGNILGKLGLKTRAQIAVWASERGLTRSDDA